MLDLQQQHGRHDNRRKDRDDFPEQTGVCVVQCSQRTLRGVRGSSCVAPERRDIAYFLIATLHEIDRTVLEP